MSNDEAGRLDGELMIRGICQQLGILLTHPLTRHHRLAALGRYIKWQIAVRTDKAFSIVVPFVGSSRLLLNRSSTPIQANYYTGLADFEMMGFLLHLLREEDLFLDVGSFNGAYTVLASEVCKSASIALEPCLESYRALTDNINLNQIQARVDIRRVAAGATSGQVNFQSDTGPGNRVMQETGKNTVVVEQTTLDAIITDKTPLLIKIDVEGYTGSVLEGAVNLLSNTNLRAIIVESWALPEVEAELARHGFQRYTYDPLGRELTKTAQSRIDELYLRDFEFIQRRLKSASAISINGITF